LLCQVRQTQCRQGSLRRRLDDHCAPGRQRGSSFSQDHAVHVSRCDHFGSQPGLPTQ
jgi:hypothetical protein